MSGILSDQYADFLEQQRVKNPLQRIGQVEDVVNTIAFLVSENASYITGALLSVDGGMATKGAF